MKAHTGESKMPIPKAYRNSRRAPWNDEPADDCPECGKTIHEVESHTEDCPDKMHPEELAEYYDEMAQPSYDPVEHKDL